MAVTRILRRRRRADRARPTGRRTTQTKMARPVSLLTSVVRCQREVAQGPGQIARRTQTSEIHDAQIEIGIGRSKFGVVQPVLGGLLEIVERLVEILWRPSTRMRRCAGANRVSHNIASAPDPHTASPMTMPSSGIMCEGTAAARIDLGYVLPWEHDRYSNTAIPCRSTRPADSERDTHTHTHTSKP
jgi:hypothetical protein